MESKKHRRLLARHRALAATFRKRKRAEAIFDQTHDRSSASKSENVFVEHSSDLGAVGIRQVIAGSALHIHGAHQGPVVPSISYKAARSARSTVCRPASPSSRESCYEIASERSDPPNLYPVMYSNLVQDEQHAHAHAPAAAALDGPSSYAASRCQANSNQADPHRASSLQASSHQASSRQANPHQAGLCHGSPYQQLHLHPHTAAANRYTAKHDSYRMISNAMAGRPAGKLRSSGCLHQRCSAQDRPCPSPQGQPLFKRPRAVNIAASPTQAAHEGQQVPLLDEVTETLERHLQTPKRRGEGPSLLCPASQLLDAPDVQHSLPFQTIDHSTAYSAGPAGSRALAGDSLLCSAAKLPASMQRLRDPRLKVDAEVPQGTATCFPWASDHPQASTHCRPLTPPQTVPQYNQFWLEGPSGHGPPAKPAGLHAVPLVKAPAGACSLGADSGSDDSVTITPGHRQTWDWSHGPLYNFRALCRAPMQHQEQQLLIAAQCGSYRSSSHMGSRACVSDTQNHLPLPLPDCSKKSYLSSQQPSLSDTANGIDHASSSAYVPSSAPSAYSSEMFSLQHELLPYCSSSPAQQPHHPQRFFQYSSSPMSPVLLPSSSVHPGLPQLPQSAARTSSSAVQLLPTKQHPLNYTSAPPSAPFCLPAFHDASLFASSVFQHTVQPASLFTQRQMTHSPSAPQALSSPLPWQTNTNFDFPVVGGSPHPILASGLHPKWSPAAVVPNNTCGWSPDPRSMVGDGKTRQKAHMGNPCGAEPDLQELHRSALDWMASDLVSAGSYDAVFHA